MTKIRTRVHAALLSVVRDGTPIAVGAGLRAVGNRFRLIDALRDSGAEADAGLARTAPAGYTVRQCCEDWLAYGLPGRAPKTVEKNSYVLQPLLAIIGGRRLRELDVVDVDRALEVLAATRSSATVGIAHLALTRAIRRAQGKNLVGRNVSALTGTPEGQAGRPSRSMTLAEVTALLGGCLGGRAADLRVHRAVAVYGDQDRGGTRAAMGSRRLRRSRQRAGPDPVHGGVAVGARERRYEDDAVAADPGGHAGPVGWSGGEGLPGVRVWLRRLA